MVSIKYALVCMALVTLYQTVSLTDAMSCSRYSEICNATFNETNEALWLSCNRTVPANSRCGCTYDYMHWSESRCVSKVNASCNSDLGDGTPLKECTGNAGCYYDSSRNGSFCYCNAEFTRPDSKGMCRATHQGPCNNNKDCIEPGSLTCNLTSHQCVCNFGDGNQEWDSSDSACKSRLGGFCHNDANPVELQRRCLAANSECVGGKCSCKENYQASGEKCVVGHEGECADNSDCGETFHCLNVTTHSSPRALNSQKKMPDPDVFHAVLANTSQCLCDPANADYDSVTKNCRTRAEKPCDLSTPCTENAACNASLCKCNEGYQADGNGKCLGLFGSGCGSSAGCEQSEYLQCQEPEKMCRCAANYRYDDVTKKCVGNLGSPCKDIGNCDADISTCTGPAENNKTCTCKTGYTQQDKDGAKICVGSFNTDCTEKLPCNANQFLTCRLTKCECALNHTWEGSQCVGLVGVGCGEGLGACTGNSTCQAVNQSNSTKLCQCNDGFAETDNNTCDSGASSVLQATFILLLTFLVAFRNSL